MWHVFIVIGEFKRSLFHLWTRARSAFYPLGPSAGYDASRMGGRNGQGDEQLSVGQVPGDCFRVLNEALR